jgi:DNA-binding response OmpR family regulator
MRICIVGDNELVRDALALVLADAGHELFFAADGASGVSIAETTSLDAVVIDYDLPDMKGDVVAVAIRKCRPNVPIILASGWYSPKTNFNGAVDLFLQKPFTPKALLGAVEQVQTQRCAVA